MESVTLTTESWATLQEVTEHLKVSEETIHRWMAARNLPTHRAGRVWRFKLTEIDAWVRDGTPAPDHNSSTDL